MAIRNPTAHPGVILASKKHLDSFGQYIDLAAGLVEQEKKRQAEKKAGLAKGMETPANFEGLLSSYVDEIHKDVNATMAWKAEQLAAGVDFTDPLSPAFREAQSRQAAIDAKGAKYRQTTTAIQNATEALAKDTDETYDRSATLANIGLLMEDPNQFEVMGSVLVPKNLSPLEIEKTALEGFSKSDVSVGIDTENKVPGHTVTKTEQNYTPEQYEMAVNDSYDRYDSYKTAKDNEFNSLSAAAKQVYIDKAKERYAGTIMEDDPSAPVRIWAAEVAGKTHGSSTLDANKNVSSGGGGTGKDAPSGYNRLTQTVAALVTGNPSFAMPVSFSDNQKAVFGKNNDWLDVNAGMQLFDLGGLRVGTYPKTEFVKTIGDNGLPVTKSVIKNTPELIETVFTVKDKDGNTRYFYSSNKTKEIGAKGGADAKKLARFSGVQDYAFEIADPLQFLNKIAENSSEYNVGVLYKELQGTGAMDAQGNVDWFKVSGYENPASSGSGYDEEAYGE